MLDFSEQKVKAEKMGGKKACRENITIIVKRGPSLLRSSLGSV